MSQLTHAYRRNPRRAQIAAAATLVALVAVALVWIGRASAEQSGPSAPAAVSKSVSNARTGKADAVDATLLACAVSSSFADMPGMSESFSFAGTASLPVIVLFQGLWGAFSEGTSVSIRLTIDGIVQSGPGDFIVLLRPSGEPDPRATHGFNFISDTLTPGTHTVKVQWRTNGVGQGCIGERSLIVLHK